MTLGSLFDGIGGWLLAARHAGVTPVWASEIEAFPQSVTARHFPEVKQLGDITKIDGAAIPPVDIVCAGSPCQDLSIAGKREGLDGARSGLFRRAVDIVRAMRRATGGRHPRFFVWENVPGAFSSNKGADFRAVLEEIGQSEIPMPPNGKWADAGMAELQECQIAWRVLDAQYWGVPQRRRRIFLVADFAADGRCAHEILFEQEGVSGNPQEGEREEQGIACDTQNSSRAAIYDMQQRSDVIRNHGEICNTLSARMGTGGNNVPVVRSYCIAGNSIDRKTHNGCNGRGVIEGAAYTLNTIDRHAVAEIYGAKSFSEYEAGKVATLRASGGAYGGDSENLALSYSIVRRLTPTECERLQGLPDGYTEGGSDTARYKALGNGMAQPCATYIIKRIAEAVSNGRMETCSC